MANDLVLLEDDLGFFPEYNLAFLVRNDLFEDYAEEAPNLEEVLNMMAGKFSDTDVAQMSYEVDVDKREPVDVARDWLIQKGLLEE